jgi:hypothetical protein
VTPSCRLRSVIIAVSILALARTLLAAEPAKHATAKWDPDVFPISFWCGPPAKFVAAERFKEVAEAGFTHAMPPCDGTLTPEQNKKLLDYAHTAGIQAFIADNRMPRGIGADGGGRSAIDAIVADYAKHPAFAGYFIGDEPGAGAFPALAQTFAYLAEKDPGHPAYVNLYPNYCPLEALGTKTYDEYVQRWIREVKPAILSYDHYHFHNKYDRPGFFSNLQVVRRESLAADLPFWQIVLLVNHFDYRMPTEAEKRFEVMQTLAFGGKGVMYFTYWKPFKDWGTAIIDLDGKRTHQYDEVKRINHDVQAIGKHLLKAKSIGVFEYGQPGDLTNTGKDIVRFDGPHITVGLFEAGETRYAMFANRDYRNAAATNVRLETAGKTIQQLDRKSGEWNPVTLKDGKLSLNLAAGDGELYRW